MIQSILLVEDSVTDAYYLKNILECHGFSVFHAKDAEESLLILEANNIDLILMDIVLPTSSGFALVRYLSKNQQFAHIPVVMCSHKSEESDKIWALKQGAVDYLVKPVPEEILLSKITNLYVC
jgi:twitching motility two-component system response regulator PilH